jgi:hypothetical protein
MPICGTLPRATSGLDPAFPVHRQRGGAFQAGLLFKNKPHGKPDAGSQDEGGAPGRPDLYRGVGVRQSRIEEALRSLRRAQPLSIYCSDGSKP